MVEEKTEAFVADGCNRNGRPWKLSALGEQAVWEKTEEKEKTIGTTLLLSDGTQKLSATMF
jgi:hypothetical protein